MPLEELPVNTHLPNGTPSTSSSHHELDKSMGEYEAQKVRESIPPSSIQSMLRLTTETGDVGEFSIRPPRVQRSDTKTSFNRSDSYISSNGGLARQHRILDPRSHRHHRPPERRPSPAFYRQNSSESGFVSHQGHSRGASQVSIQNLHHLDRFTSRIPAPPDLLHHKSIGSLRNQHQRPRSPYAYPTRLRRPGYRSPSPSLSDRPNAALPPGGSSIRTASPSSLYSQRRVPPGYHSGFNQSSASPALPPGPPGHLGINPSPLPSRVGTPFSYRAATPVASRAPTPAPSLSSNISHVSHSAQALRLVGSVAGSIRSPSPAPLYYDYTEGFEEAESPCAPQNASMLSLPLSTVNQIIPEDEILAMSEAENLGSAVRPAELPTPFNRRSSEKSLSVTPQEHTNGHWQSVVQSHSRPSFASSIPRPSFASSRPRPSFAIEREVKAKTPESLAKGTATSGNRSTSLDDLERKPSRKSSSSYHLSLLSSSLRKRDLKSLSSRIDSITSSALGEPADRDSGQQVSLMLPKPTYPVSESDNSASSGGWKLPSLNFSRLTLTSTSENTNERTRSPTAILKSQHSEILAPTPERPASSQSHHHRFSKILSIDDTFLEQPETLTIFDASGTSITPDTSVTQPEGYVRTFRTRESFHFPKPPMPNRRLKAVNSLPIIPQRRGRIPVFEDINNAKLARSQSSDGEAVKNTEIDKKEVTRLSDTATPRVVEDELVDEMEACHDKTSQDASAVTFDLEVPDRLSSPTHAPDDGLVFPTIARSMNDLPALPRPSEDSRPKTSNDTHSRTSRPGSRMMQSPLVSQPAPVFLRHRRSTPLIRDDDSQETQTNPEPSALQRFRVKLRSGRDSAVSRRDSTVSPPASRPWNHDENYPWADIPQQIVETPPKSSLHTQDEKKDDKLTLSAKIKRRLTSPRETGRMITKRLSISSDVSRLGSSKAPTREPSPKPPALPEISEILGHPLHPVNNTLNASNRASHISTTYSMSMPPSLFNQRLPSPTSLPFTDLRSVFSDDSSQYPPRGSLRKRLSNLTGRRSAGKKPSFTDARTENDQPATTQTERKRSHTATGDDGTVGMGNFEYSRRKMIGRLKDWLQRFFGRQKASS